MFITNSQFIKQQLFFVPPVVEYVHNFTTENNVFQSLSKTTLLISVVL